MYTQNTIIEELNFNAKKQNGRYIGNLEITIGNQKLTYQEIELIDEDTYNHIISDPVLPYEYYDYHNVLSFSNRMLSVSVCDTTFRFIKLKETIVERINK